MNLKLLIRDVARSFKNKKISYNQYLCKCGNKFLARTDSVKSGNTKSCGCLKNKHLKTKSITYKSWAMAKNRCISDQPKIRSFYKNKKIKWYEPWNDFKTFLNDVGERPGKEYSLDRINGNKGYIPGNVRWATKREQNLNKSKYKNGSSIYKGVSYRPKVNKTHPWYASISVNRKQICIGYFSNEKDAAIAYNKYAIIHNKEEAKLNIFY